MLLGAIVLKLFISPSALGPKGPGVLLHISKVFLFKASKQQDYPLSPWELPLCEGHSVKRCLSKECQKPELPVLLKKVSQYTSNLNCNTPPICMVPLRSEERETLPVLFSFDRSTPPICIAMRPVPCALRKGKHCQYSSHLIAVRLPFVLQYASQPHRSTFGKVLGRYACRTKLPPKKNWIDTKHGVKDTKERSEKRSETCLKNVKPLSQAA